MTNVEAIMYAANQMIDAADGYADDELVLFNHEKWSASRLREIADDLIDANIEAWADQQMREMVRATRDYHTDF